MAKVLDGSGAGKLRIAQLAPPWFPIPPRAYGGIENVIADLTDGLLDLGHEVALIAPGDSRTRARLIPSLPRHAGLDLTLDEKEAIMARIATATYRQARMLGVDILHDHTDVCSPPGYPVPVMRTIHGPAVPEVVARYADYSARGDAFVAISHRQRALFEEASAAQLGDRRAIRFAGVVHNPLNVAAVPFGGPKGDFVFFMGRCDWEKGPDAAIRIARAAGLPLVLALRVNRIERPYFERAVEPLLGPDVTLLPELDGVEKYEYLRRDRAVIFSSQWEEPFGMVMIEAMACGTPVVAFRRGAAPELIVDEVTGFLGEDEAELAAALRDVGRLDPHACRRHVDAHFTPRLIAARYAAAYRAILDTRRRLVVLTRPDAPLPADAQLPLAQADGTGG